MMPHRRFPSHVASFASLALFIGASVGCHQEMNADVLAPTSGPQRAPEATSQGRSPAARTKRNLDQRLAAIELQLDRSLLLEGDERRLLARQRLVLSIAIAEMKRRVEIGDSQPVDVDRLLTGVEIMLAAQRLPGGGRASRGRASRGRASGGQAVTTSRGPSTLLERLDGAGQAERDDKRDAAVSLDAPARGKAPRRGQGRRGKEKRGCAPGDLSCDPLERAEPVAAAGPVEEERRGGDGGRVEKARVESESRPRNLMTAVQRRVAAMESCLGSLDDDVTLQVTLRMDAGGAVRAAKVSGIDGGAASCVSRVLKRVRVPDHDGGTRIVRFPLYFQP